MKKLLSILLVVLMIVSSVPFVYAEESNTYKVGDIIQFGSYPQSEVTDSATRKALDKLTPDWSDWTSYNYYKVWYTIPTPTPGDWMRYTDVIYKGSKYRCVMISSYRPCHTGCYVDSTTTLLRTYQDNNYYFMYREYWFKFEPIHWRVLDPMSGLVMCETLIDSQPFDNLNKRDYETSSIREWLNNDFYNVAFSENEKAEINISTLNNYHYEYNYNDELEFIIDSKTNDKIFLLSYDDILNSEYGFNPNNIADISRRAQGSEYAKCQGLYTYRTKYETLYPGCHAWWIRESFNINYDGTRNGGYADETCTGIRPAFSFRNISSIDQMGHQHTYELKSNNAATHLTKGTEIFACECGDIFSRVTSKLEEHTYTTTITKVPSHVSEGLKTSTCICGDSYTVSIPKTDDHGYEQTVTPATCTEDGLIVYTCECGDTYSETLNPTGHTYNSEVTKANSHLEEGIKTFTCACGDSYTEVIEKLSEHTYKTVVISPTCKEPGIATYTCECGDTYSETLNPTGHTYNSEITKENSHLEEGVKTFTCTCGDSYTEVIPMGEHIFDYNEETCQICGYDRTDDCNCNCHKGGISGLIFKIILFFQRIFKTNKTCACGVNHY